MLVAQSALLALGAALGWLPVVAGTTLLFILWQGGADPRWALTAALCAGALTLYTGGHLTRDLSIVMALSILAVVLALREYHRAGFSLPLSRPALALALYMGILLYGAGLGVLRGNSLKFMGIEMASLLSLLTAILSPLYRIRQNGMRHLLWTGLAVTSVSSAFGFAAFLYYHRRLGDAWFSPIPAMAAVALVSVGLFSPGGPRRWGALLLAVIPLTHLVLSFTRGYWLGFLAAGASLVAVQFASSRDRRGALGRAGLSAVAVTGLGALGYLAVSTVVGGNLASSFGTRFWSSFTTQNVEAAQSNVIRLVEWDTALRLIRHNPVLGYGAGAELVVQNPFFGFRVQQPYLHNMLVFQWYKTGLPGVIALVTLFTVFIRASWRQAVHSGNWQGRALAAAIFANTVFVAVTAMTNYAALTVVWVSQPLGLMWGLLLPLKDRNGKVSVDWADWVV